MKLRLVLSQTDRDVKIIIITKLNRIETVEWSEFQAHGYCMT